MLTHPQMFRTVLSPNLLETHPSLFEKPSLTWIKDKVSLEVIKIDTLDLISHFCKVEFS